MRSIEQCLLSPCCFIATHSLTCDRLQTWARPELSGEGQGRLASEPTRPLAADGDDDGDGDEAEFAAVSSLAVESGGDDDGDDGDCDDDCDVAFTSHR